MSLAGSPDAFGSLRPIGSVRRLPLVAQPGQSSGPIEPGSRRQGDGGRAVPVVIEVGKDRLDGAPGLADGGRAR